MKRQILVPVFLILAFIITGFLREYTFLNINQYLIDTDLRYSENAPVIFKLFHYFTTGDLYYAKFFLTLFFCSVYACLTVIAVSVVFASRKFTLASIFLYGLLFLVSFGSFIFGGAVGDVDQGYAIARYIAGVLQSPIIVMVLIPVFMYIRKTSGEAVEA